MMRSLVGGCALIAWLTSAPPTISAQFVAGPAQVADGAVSAQGVGSVRVSPIRTVLYLTVSASTEPTTAEAMTVLSATVDRVIEALVAAGVSQDDIDPWGLAASSGAEEMMGPMASSTPRANAGIRAVVREVGRTAEIAGIALLNGAESVQNAVYEIGPEPEARERAAAMALRNARAEAEAVARAAGGRLGALIGLSTAPGYGALLSSQVLLSSYGRGPSLVPQDPSVQVSVQAKWAFVSN